ncbi:hypothetical protein CCHR01_05469 [Colletotrichum chrysophilum]|uniref:Uncharacterized protein n=1 Tax=Colletotrichum chrysophilum TaxID=1836956 RepID=A0AAD9AQZ6_9PEZI|nr:hypothetical protein K456DRAFT_177474 [Colletotrichum gloeosporioides 23]KAK1851874.1 hypothetical protein CCHR01_05469 [Colletotrichum chrysophilum]
MQQMRQLCVCVCVFESLGSKSYTRGGRVRSGSRARWSSKGPGRCQLRGKREKSESTRAKRCEANPKQGRRMMKRHVPVLAADPGQQLIYFFASRNMEPVWTTKVPTDVTWASKFLGA